MPKLDHANIGDVAKTRYLTGTLISVDGSDDTAEVSIAGKGIIGGIPCYYHCDPEAVARSNGALEGGSGAFSEDDQVIIQEKNGFLRVIGHADGVKKPCAFMNFRIIRDDGFIFKPEDLDNTNTELTVTLKDQDGNTRVIGVWRAGSFIEQSGFGTMTFSGNTWNLKLSPSYGDGWVPGDSPNGYWASVIVRDKSDSSILAEKTIDTQYPRKFDTTTWEDNGDLVLPGIHDLEIPLWDFSADAEGINPILLGSPPQYTQSNVNEHPQGLQSGDTLFTAGMEVDISIKHTIEYRINRSPDAFFTAEDERGNFFSTASLVTNTEAHLGNPTLRSVTFTALLGLTFNDPTLLDQSVNPAFGSPMTITDFRLTPKNDDFVV